jgi:hypothetical protein
LTLPIDSKYKFNALKGKYLEVLFSYSKGVMSLAKFRAGNEENEEQSSKDIKPERNLLSAVLARAICDAFGTAQCDRHIVRSARQWLFGALTPTKAFSFAWVSQHLDLDPIALQQTLKSYEGDPEILNERLSFLR